MSNFPSAGVYTVDTVHSNIGFVVRHLVVSKVRGLFSEFAGVITIGDTTETSSVTATVQAASVSTNNEQRDGHLKSSDFFDLENHPTLTLASTAFTPKGDNEYVLTADLTIRGVTKSVDFDVEFTGSIDHYFPGVTAIGFEAKASIDRRDFGVNFENTLENGTAVVSHKIDLVFEIEATNQA